MAATIWVGEAIELLDPLPVDAGRLQVDPMHETGRVTVELDAGQPSYTIHQPAAWDFLELSDEWVQLAERADAICFGSLAQRSSVAADYSDAGRADLVSLRSRLRCEPARAVLFRAK